MDNNKDLNNDLKKEPIVPNIKPSADDIALRQKQMQARRQAAQRAALAKSAPVASAQPAKQTLAVVAAVIALAAAGLSGYLFMQLQQAQQQLANAQQIITKQGANLQSLNDKLSVTGENANLSVDALKVLVKENNKEIRKLWDLSNKRNRPAIASNKKALGSVKTTAANNAKAVKKNTSGLAAQKKSLQQVKSELTASLDKNSSALSSRLKKVEAQASDLPEAQLRISQNTESLQALEARVAKIKQTGDIGDMRLEMEDIQIRLDRIQNALSAPAQ